MMMRMADDVLPRSISQILLPLSVLFFIVSLFVSCCTPSFSSFVYYISGAQLALPVRLTKAMMAALIQFCGSTNQFLDSSDWLK